MKKIFILALLASCATARKSSNWYTVTESKPVANRFLVQVKGLKGKFLLPPPEGKTRLSPGDSINIFFFKRIK